MDISTFAADGSSYYDISLLPLFLNNRTGNVDPDPAILSDSHVTHNPGTTQSHEVNLGTPSPMDILEQIDRRLIDITCNNQDALADVPHKRRKLNWDLVYGPFTKLYKDEGRSLAETRRILNREYGFAAS